MKNVCDNCSAKYSIADEKVAGRVFKIRCKKCDSAIVVRGDQLDGAGEEDESTRVVDYGGEAVWHVVVEGDQQGPFAPSQIGEMLAAGTIGWDAYVWMEGFDDWKPAQDVEELVSAVMGSEQASGGAAGGGGDMGMGADPFASTAHAAAPLPEDDDPFNAHRGAGADLFAQSESASPFGGGGEEEESDVVSSPVAPRAHAEQSLTGARNENSVLFSLSNLQALATGGNGSGGAPSASAASPSPGPMQHHPSPGMASGEGSGLIDIRALASATGMSGGGPAITPIARHDRVDDLLSIGGGASGLGSSLGAPVLMPEKKEESSNKGIVIGAVAVVTAVVLAAAAVVVIVVTQDNGTPPADLAASAAVTGGPETVTPTPTGETPPTEGEPSGVGAAPTDEAAAEEPEAAGTEENGAEPANETPGNSNTGRRRDRPSRGGDTPSEATPTPTATPPARERGGDRTIDDLLGDALNEGPGRGRTPAADREAPAGGNASGPQTPARNDVMSAMGGVQGAVSACGNGTHGNAIVRVIFSGSNGRVASADVSQGSFPPPVRTCIARAVRGARVPPFRQDRFTVNYPFRL